MFFLTHGMRVFSSAESEKFGILVAIIGPFYHYDTAISTDFVFLSDCSSTKSIVKNWLKRKDVVVIVLLLCRHYCKLRNIGLHYLALNV